MNRILFYIAFFFCTSAYAQSPFEFRNVDINFGIASSYPLNFSTVNGQLIFSAYTNSEGREPWVSNGTDLGTVLLDDLDPAKLTYDNFKFCPAQGKTFFTNGGSCYVTDGTTAGTIKLSAADPKAQTGTMLGNHFLFAGPNGAIWKTDGTVGGTSFIYDSSIHAGSTPSSMVTMNNIGYFIRPIAKSGNAAMAFFKTDGTTTGTILVKIFDDVREESNGAIIYKMGSKLLILARTPTLEFEWWISDGTTAGTTLLKKFNELGNYNPWHVATGSLNGQIFFTTENDTNGYEPWITDGTVTGTHLVKDINRYMHSSMPQEFTEYNNKLYFSADNGTHGRELWVTDGTDTGTKMVRDIFPGSIGSAPHSFAVFRNELYFVATSAAADTQLYKTDGLAVTLVSPPGISRFNALAGNKELLAIDSVLYFKAAYGMYGYELWMIVDTSKPSTSITSHTTDVADWYLYPNPANGTFIINMQQKTMHNGNIRIYDAAGRLVVQEDIQQGEEKIPIVLSGIAKGIYTIQVQLGNENNSRQLILQ